MSDVLPLTDPLRETLAGHLARFERRSVPLGDRRPAAVAGRETRVAHYEQPVFAWR